MPAARNVTEGLLVKWAIPKLAQNEIEKLAALNKSADVIVNCTCHARMESLTGVETLTKRGLRFTEHQLPDAFRCLSCLETFIVAYIKNLPMQRLISSSPNYHQAKLGHQ